MLMPGMRPALTSATIIGGKSDQHARAAADFYPTPPECTAALLDAFPGFFGQHVWEPACGDGAISRVLEGRDMTVISTDLRHTGYGTGGVDALRTRPEHISSAITNPPFNLAADFIEHLRTMAVPFALLLKATYWHAKTRHDLFRLTGPLAVCPMLWRPNFAIERGKSPTMDFCWTVWAEQPALTCRYQPLEKPTHV